MNEWKCGSSVSCSKWECGGTVGGDPNWKLPQLLSWWCLSAFLTSGSGLWRASAGSSKPGAPHDWFSELDYSQSDINCQLVQQLRTSPHHLHHSRQTEPSDQKVQGGHFEPTVIPNAVWGSCSLFRRRSTKAPFSQGFHSRRLLEKGCIPASLDAVRGFGAGGGGGAGFCCLARVVVVVQLNGRFLGWP